MAIDDNDHYVDVCLSSTGYIMELWDSLALSAEQDTCFFVINNFYARQISQHMNRSGFFLLYFLTVGLFAGTHTHCGT